MADSFLDSAGGWTPVPDKLVRDYGFEVAYVWGKVWRYCQMQNGACTASHETIAKRAGMSRRTLIDKLNILIEAGYIEDKTPDLKNKPHTYCTRIGEGKITSAMQISHTEIDMPLQDDNELGMRNLHSDNADNAQPDTPTMQNLTTEDAEIAQPTMQNLHLKKDSKETIKETKESKSGGKPPAPPGVTVFIEVTKRHVLNNTQILEIDERVGRDPPALDKWRETVKAWQLAGHKINNISGMLDWFKKGIPVYAQKASQNGTYQSNSRKGIKALEETGESLRGKPTIDIYTNEYVYPDKHREPIPPVPRVPRRGLL